MTQELQQNLEPVSNPVSNDSRTAIEFDLEPSNFDLEPSNFEFPLSKVRAGKLLEISDRTVGNWLKKMEEIHQPVGNAALMTNPKGQITEWGFHCLQRFQLEKEEGYRDRVWKEAGVEAPAEPGGKLALVDPSNESSLDLPVIDLPPLDLPEIDIPDADNIPDASALAVELLNDETQNLLAAARKYQATTNQRYSRSRAIRRRNLIGQAIRDAAEDVNLYNQAYDSSVSQALGQHTQGLDAQ